MATAIGVPERNEYAEHFAEYVSRVPNTDIFGMLERQLKQYLDLVPKVSEAAAAAHRDGKWSLKETLGHVNESERVFGYRALAVSRGEKAPLPSFDQDLYVANGDAQQRSVADLLDEFANLRRATIASFRNMTPEMANRRGTASGKEVSARAVLYILAGHAERHLELIRERYGV